MQTIMMPVGLDERYYPQPGDPVGWTVPKQTAVNPKGETESFGVGEAVNFRIKGDGSDKNPSRLLASVVPMTFAHGGTVSLFTHLYNALQNPEATKNRLASGIVQSPGLHWLLKLLAGMKSGAKAEEKEARAEALKACAIATGLVINTDEHDWLAMMWAADLHFRYVLDHFIGRLIRDNRFSVENKSETFEVQLSPY
jgi:hypothetical protein